MLTLLRFTSSTSPTSSMAWHPSVGTARRASSRRGQFHISAHTHTHTHTHTQSSTHTHTHTHTWTHAHTHSWKPSDSSLFISRTPLAFICHSLSHTQTRTHTRTHTQQTHANLFHKSQKMR